MFINSGMVECGLGRGLSGVGYLDNYGGCVGCRIIHTVV